jgi:hypothetical protein
MENYNQDQLTDHGLKVDNEVRHELSESSKWAKFLSMTIFVFCGIFLIVAIIGSTALVTLFDKMDMFGSLASMSGGIIIGVIVFIVALVAVVYYFLYNFSVKMKLALQTDNEQAMNAAISSLKTFFIISAIGSGLTLLSTLSSLF